MAKAIVCVSNDLYTDQRVHKVCLFLLTQGYSVQLVGRKRKNSPEMDERPYATHRMKLLFETGAKFYAFFNLRLFFFLLFRKCDLIVSNDLDTLLACHTAKRWKRKTRLVYDSHEYFTEVPELTSRPRVQKIWLRIERRIFPKLESVYTVNNSIAAIYRSLYGKEVKVVRNISPCWNGDRLMSKAELGIPENKALVILQGAGINVDRGAEEAVEAMQGIDAVLMIVGDGDVVPQLKERVAELHLEEKVLFYGKKPYTVMMNYTQHADIGLTLDKATNLNYRLSLPNKVFDYMHAGTVVVASDVQEVAAVVRKHKIGEIIENLDVDSLRTVLNNLLMDPELLAVYKTNSLKAAETENWENETRILAEIYPRIAS
ncbi:MAG: hypothetical protein A3D92_14040 [Bacteroidetes bacterium RIFCSPHIGHO2_02_FULL_44_7]|nr:MAG: hypothetical protein A3D92_14040 [Bacteroidetes bacterium RIFCSPHIGHO2_02_FULL_44_7]